MEATTEKPKFLTGIKGKAKKTWTGFKTQPVETKISEVAVLAATAVTSFFVGKKIGKKAPKK
jgi:hypothetical protein